ncbi:MAG: radical SAM family heme chaperone HemW [Bacteroidales bacterium]|nr:radical SAM family heme chaperone HemW [Bacteroidales bacterium]
MIYIHVPFCHRKCTYCAFYSHGAPASRRQTLYVDNLIEEMRQRRGEQSHPIRTVYFGGGTPSILPLEQLTRIVDALHECFDLSQVEEVTLEANPEDLTVDYLQGLRNIGLVNRLSIGIQTLDDEMLRLIGRRHTAQQALDAVQNAYDAGFHNISVDFIYGLPLHFQSSFFNFQLVTHVSAYALTVEPGTALARQVEQGRVVLPGDDEVVRQYFALHDTLIAKGFVQYEVSNYCRPGCHSRHNSRYWDRTPYLGLGPGAHSFDGLHRRWNGPMGAESGEWRVENEETLTDDDAFNELLMTSLRTTRGIPLDMVPDKYKEELHRKIQPYIACGWIVERSEVGGMRCEPTTEGLLYADGMAADLFLA